MHAPMNLMLVAEGQTFAVVGMTGEEAISELYRFELDIVCEAGQTLPTEVGPGADVTLVFYSGNEPQRQVHGVIESRRTRIDTESDDPRYHIVLVPHLIRATLVRTQQVFLGVSVLQIIQHKLALVGLDETAVSLAQLDTGAYPVRDIVVQFDETDLAFISRLCEHLGVSFYFEQRKNAEVVVFADGPNDFSVNAQAEAIHLSRALNESNCVHALELTETLTPGSYIVYDYNYRRPDLWLMGKESFADGHGGGVLEYACHAKDEVSALNLAAIRAQERACRARTYEGKSSIMAMAAGGVTTLEASDDFAETELIVTRVFHELWSKTDDRGSLHYRNRFEALERTHPFRPERRTPRPRMHGFVTGTVQGPPGTPDAVSPYLDPEGRYTVQFHFDTVLGDPTLRGSHLMRMAQPFGGTGHGMHFPLRPGTEVMIAFANGDPDRPIIAGAIPNAHTRTPVTASNATQNRITAASGAIFEISERR